MERSTLLQIVESLEPIERDNLSAVRVALTGDTATATLSISCVLPVGTVATMAGPYQIAVALSDLPAGVTSTGWVRYPDITRLVTFSVPMEDQIRALHVSDIVGALDASRYDGGAVAVRAGHPATSWIIKTHAGSDNERAAWATRGHGGRRAGAGRKPVGDEAMVRRTVTLPGEIVAVLEQLGEGNLSAGVRIAAECARQDTPPS